MVPIPKITPEKFQQLPESAQIEFLDLLDEEITYRKNNPLKFLIPNLPQADLIHAISQMFTTGKRRFVLTCANRVGKSTIIMAILAAIVTGLKQTAFSILPHWPFNKKIWIVANKDNVKENLLDIFDALIEGSEYTVTKDGKAHNSHYIFPGTGFHVYVKTYGQQDDTFESTTVGGLVFDEPPKISIWNACKSRLMQGGMLLMGATPLFGAGYLYDEVVAKAMDKKSIFWHKEAAIYENIQDDGFWYINRQKRLVFLRPFEENKLDIPDILKKKHGKLPGIWTRQELLKYGYDEKTIEVLHLERKGKLPLSEIRVAIEEFDDESYEARVFGKFKFLSGAVYKRWPEHRKDIYIQIPPRNWQTRYIHRMTIDPHDRKPPVAIWTRIDQWKTRSVLREWPSEADECYGHRMFHHIPSAEPYNVADFVAFWIKIERELGIVNTEENRIKCLMDPNFGNKPNSVTGKLIYEEYQDEFRRQGSPRMINTTVLDDLTSGHEAVRSVMKPTPNGDRKLFIDLNCTNMDYGLRNYMYLDWSGKAADTKAVNESVQTKNKDYPDVLRYEVMAPIHFPEAVQPVPKDMWARAAQRAGIRKPAIAMDQRLKKLQDLKSGLVQRPKGAKGV